MQISRENFVERRRSGIGGSDIAAIVGLSDWSTPYDVWRSKVDPDREREAKTSASIPVRKGVALEALTAELFAEKTGLKVQRCNHQFTAPEVPFFTANLDRVIVDKGRAPVVRGELRTREILECKAPTFVSAEWGEEWSDQIPENYRCQVQWYMGVTGAERTYLAALLNADCKVYIIDRDEEQIAFLFQEGARFWHDYVEPQLPPPVKTYEDAAKRYRTGVHGWTRTADASLMAAIADYRQMTAIIDEAEYTRDALKARICAAMGDATEIRTEAGQKLATWSASKESTKIDYKGIVNELAPDPAIIEKYTTKTATARRFMLAAQK